VICTINSVSCTRPYASIECGMVVFALYSVSSVSLTGISAASKPSTIWHASFLPLLRRSGFRFLRVSNIQVSNQVPAIPPVRGIRRRLTRLRLASLDPTLAHPRMARATWCEMKPGMVHRLGRNDAAEPVRNEVGDAASLVLPAEDPVAEAFRVLTRPRRQQLPW
jgi:hypothetical protein